MKEVVCILKPGFYKKSGARYGPVFNETCVVLKYLRGFDIGYEEGPYKEELYYYLQGYSELLDDDFVCGFPVFRAIHFADILSNEELETLIEEVYEEASN